MDFPLKMSKTYFYTTEISKNNITTKNIYEKEAERLLKNKDVKVISYDVYKNRLMLWFLSSSLIIAIQTHIPSFEVRNSRKMRGYPFTESKMKTSLNYMAEVLFKLRKSQSVP